MAIACAFALVVVGVIVLSIAFSGLVVSIKRMRQTDEIVKAVFELKLLATEYQQSQIQRIRDQWQSRYTSFLDELRDVQPRTEKQQFILAHMMANHASLGHTFAAFDDIPPPSSDESRIRHEALHNRMMARMDASLMAMVSDANQLSDSIYRDMVRGQWQAITTLGISLLAMVGVIVGLTIMIHRAAIRPLFKLQQDTAVIGAGDLDHRTLIRTSDEIGELSKAFDTMVERLRSVMARRDELDREISQRKLAEEELRKTLDELRCSNRDLEQFAYVASHDLQEPLRKVIAFGSLLEDEYADKLEDEGRLYVHNMEDASQRMQRLISDLLKYSRVTTRGERFVPVEMNDTVQGVLSDLEERIRETEGTVDVAELPVIDADPMQMRQLMQNLVGNAFKFHREGENPHVKVYVEKPPSLDGDGVLCAHMVVEDNGIGIDEKYVERIFGVFQRLHGRYEYAGSGIGLAVCRRIAERHGGTVVVRSKQNEGAKFIVSLPVKHTEGDKED